MVETFQYVRVINNKLFCWLAESFVEPYVLGKKKNYTKEGEDAGKWRSDC